MSQQDVSSIPSSSPRLIPPGRGWLETIGAHRQVATSSNALLTAALHYAKRGWPVLPLHWIRDDGECSCGKTTCKPGKHPYGILVPNGFKDATTDANTIRRWWRSAPSANIGIATGKRSGIIVLDVDDNAALEDLERRHGKLPQTAESLTGGGGRHLLYRYPDAGDIGCPNVSDALHVRGDGGLIVAPPSLHVSGREYTWHPARHPDQVQLADAPQWLLSMMTTTTAPTPVDADSRGVIRILGQDALHFIAFGAEVGTQRTRALAATRNLLACGYSIEDSIEKIHQGLQNSPIGEPERPWTLEDARLIVEDLASKPAPPPRQRITPATEQVTATVQVATTPVHRTDWGNAKRLVQMHGEDLRYCDLWGSWLVWDGTRWVKDDTREVTRRAKDVVSSMYAEAAGIADQGERKALARWAISSESTHRVRAMLESAKSERPLPILPEQLDANPWLLNVQNGTVDLRTGNLLPHQRQHLITKSAPVMWDPAARCDLWLSFLDRIMGGNQELIQFLQRAIGYSLTADTREDVLFIAYGTGANGKSTLLGTIAAMSGDYGMKTPTETLMLRAKGSIPNDIARLKGARLVTAIEAEQGQRLAESVVKAMTGGAAQEPIAARFLHHEWFEFIPTFKIWLGTNHKPVIHGTDYAIWRRIRLIPFNVKIPELEQDKGLPDKLRQELPGILAWAVEGCLAWQSGGLGTPPEVLRATSDYRAEMDILSGFLDDCCIASKQAEVAVKDLYEAYTDWCETNGEKAIGKRTFGTKLRERDFDTYKATGGVRTWQGIGLLTEQVAD